MYSCFISSGHGLAEVWYGGKRPVMRFVHLWTKGVKTATVKSEFPIEPVSLAFLDFLDRFQIDKLK